LLIESSSSSAAATTITRSAQTNITSVLSQSSTAAATHTYIREGTIRTTNGGTLSIQYGQLTSVGGINVRPLAGSYIIARKLV
jgi:hypothetical protein